MKDSKMKRENGNNSYIPYGKQMVDEEDIQEVVEVLRSDWLTTGPKIEEFEHMVAQYTNTRYAVAVSNGTAALHAACFAAGIGTGDEVITTPVTFAASANCVLYCGGRPVFADIDAGTYNIDPKDIRRKVTPRTKAVIAVHLAGQPCDMDSIHEIAQEYGLIVIEDAAHALGAEYKGQKIGSLSDMTVFSFHPVKPITTGEGGMIMTNNDALFHRLRLFRSHGIEKDINLCGQQEGPWYYEQQILGYNYRISDIQCALGVSQMRKLDVFLQRRRELAARYDQAFAGCADIILPYQMEQLKSGWHLYIIQLLHHDRKKIFLRMRELGIGVNVHYIPIYRHPYYQHHGYSGVHCRNAERLYENMMSLPLYPMLTDQEQNRVIECLKSLLIR